MKHFRLSTAVLITLSCFVFVQSVSANLPSIDLDGHATDQTADALDHENLVKDVLVQDQEDVSDHMPQTENETQKDGKMKDPLIDLVARLKSPGEQCRYDYDCQSNSCVRQGSVSRCSSSGNPSPTPNPPSNPSSKLGNGYSCSYNNQCQSNYCNPNQRTCQSNNNNNGKLPTWSNCNNSNECQSNYCLNRRCELKTNGHSCSNSSECQSNNCMMTGNQRTCQNSSPSSSPGNLPTGSNCNNSNECQSNYCLNRRCELKTNGHSCSNNSECQSNNCIMFGNQRTCQLLSDGMSCNNNSECSSNSCINRTCGQNSNGNKPEGQQCYNNQECQSNSCIQYGNIRRCGSSNGGNGSKQQGEQCNSNQECQSNSCISAGRVSRCGPSGLFEEYFDLSEGNESHTGLRAGMKK